MKALHLVALAMLTASGGAAAAPQPDDNVMVPLFLDACAKGDLTYEAREAAIAADSQWVAAADTDDLDIAAFGKVPSISINFDYRHPTAVREWTRTADGKTIRLVLARFPADRRYPTLCGLLVPDVRNVFPYSDPFEAGVKAIGLKGKSTDLPHYFEYSGKLPGGRPARGDIFSRTRVLGGGDNMHMYVAF